MIPLQALQVAGTLLSYCLPAFHCRRVDSRWPWPKVDLVVCSTNSLSLSSLALIQGRHNIMGKRGLVCASCGAASVSLRPSMLHNRLTVRVVRVLCTRALRSMRGRCQRAKRLAQSPASLLHLSVIRQSRHRAWTSEQNKMSEW